MAWDKRQETWVARGSDSFMAQYIGPGMIGLSARYSELILTKGDGIARFLSETVLV